jgi:hypothetical protein
MEKYGVRVQRGEMAESAADAMRIAKSIKTDSEWMSPRRS